MIHFIFTVLALCISSPAVAETHFTTVFYDDGGIVYLGLKRTDGDKSESQIITFPFNGGERVRIPLPKEIEDRDVVGLIPEKKKVFVVTLKSETEKDGVMLHVFDKANGSWVKLGQQTHCPSFTKANLSSTRMTFFCELPASKRTRRKGGSVTAKTISYGKERLYRSGTWRFPEFMLRYKGAFLILEGKAPKWDRLRLKPSQDGEERVLLADEVFQLPVPNTLPPSVIPRLPAQPAAATE